MRNPGDGWIAWDIDDGYYCRWRKVMLTVERRRRGVAYGNNYRMVENQNTR